MRRMVKNVFMSTVVSALVSLSALAWAGTGYTTASASNITETSATLNGTAASTCSNICGITFSWGLDTNYGATAAASPSCVSVDTVPVTHTVSNLQCNTTYHYKLSGNPCLTTFQGSDITFTTAACGSTPCSTGKYNFGAGCVKPTPEQGLTLLTEGNARFVAGTTNNHLEQFSTPAVRTEVAAGQKPFAVVLTCSDSRLPPEILFDQGLGEIFVVRVAGNVVAPHQLGSIEYALEHLHANLIVVLGHEKCGAVGAAYDNHYLPADLGPNLNNLIATIEPAVAVALGPAPKAADAAGQAAQMALCVEENINQVAEKLLTDSTIIRELVEGNSHVTPAIPANSIKIVRGNYALETGVVTFAP